MRRASRSRRGVDPYHVARGAIQLALAAGFAAVVLLAAGPLAHALAPSVEADTTSVRIAVSTVVGAFVLGALVVARRVRSPPMDQGASAPKGEEEAPRS